MHKVEVTIIADRVAGEAEVRARVEAGESGGVTEALVAATTALVTLMDLGLKINPNSDIVVREIRLS